MFMQKTLSAYVSEVGDLVGEVRSVVKFPEMNSIPAAA